MSHADLVAHVRQLVQRMLGRRCVNPVSEMKESLLIHDGAYCGRRFLLGKVEAIWLSEETQIQIFDAEKKLVDTVAVAVDSEQSQLQAA